MPTLNQRLDSFNNSLKSTILNSLNLEPLTKFKSHKEADTFMTGIVETCEKQGHKANIVDGLLELTFVKPVEVPNPKKTSKVAAAPIVNGEQDDTSKLIDFVISAEEIAGSKWDQTGLWIYERKAAFATDAKENRKVAYNLLDSSAPLATKIPIEGEDKDGKTITLRKKNGSIKWAAWVMTRRWTQNFADIFKAVEVSGWDEVFPKGKLVNRTKIVELSKTESAGENPIDTFLRSIKLAEKKMTDELDKKECMAQVTEAIANLNAAYASFAK